MIALRMRFERRHPALFRTSGSLALVLLAVISLCACGAGDETVASVGGAKVTRATLNHWMQSVVGTDYTTELEGAVPVGLVSDPPHYGRCVSGARRIVNQGLRKAKLTAAQLLMKCRQLSAAIKQQALAFVLAGLQSRAEAAELGIPTPTAAEVTQGVRALAGSDYKTEATFRKMLARQRRSIADVRYEVITNLINRRILARIQARATRLGGGEAAIFRLVTQNSTKWRKRTSCQPGYRALECRQFRPKNEVKPQGVTILELLYKGVA
jgi:hypothetical protein